MSRIQSFEETLFADALARPEEERAAFLDDACRGDAAMRERILALLAAHTGPRSLLAAAPIQRIASHGVPVIGLAAVEENPGDIIGHYKLLQKIGEGGCGVVWMAEQEEPVRRRVALKIIKLGMDTKAVVARFEAERQALAMMDHPCIAKVHDAGSTETGRPYFVMELVRGIPITKYCDENHLTPTARLELFIKVCQAIQHAHQKGVIHRDIKSSNILVTVNDGAPTPKVIDFGIAKATQGKLTDATVFTAFEQFIGTPVYMSPEQAEMSSLDIDTRSDIYSLGVLLYELLTGRPPFDPKAFAQAGVDRIRKQIREVEPPRPSARLKTLDADERTTIARLRGTAESQLSVALRGDLDWIVMRCIEKDRTRRYDTANGLAMDIQRYLRNEPVIARPPSAAYLIRKLIRRHRIGFAAAAVILVAIGVGAIVSTWQAIRATRAEHLQSLLREAAQGAQAKEANLRQIAVAQERAARLRAYAADMNLVQQALATDNLGRAKTLLNRHRPKPGEADLRGWEWRYLWRSCQSEAVAVLGQKPNPIRSLAVSPDGKWLAIAQQLRGGLSLLNLQTRVETPVVARGSEVTFSAFSPRGELLAVSADNGADVATREYFVVLLDLSTGRELRRLKLDSLCSGLFFSEDGATLITSSSDRQHGLARWRVADGEMLSAYASTVIDRDDGYGNGVAVSPDLRLAAQAATDVGFRPASLIRVIDLASGKEHWRGAAAEERVRSVAISFDGKLLATGEGFSRGEIRLWDIAAKKEVRRLVGHHAWVSTQVFWPDGTKLATASADQTIRIWEVATGRLLRTLRGHTLEVWALVLLPDNRTLVSGSKDGTILLWDTAAPARNSGYVSLPGNFPAWRIEADSQSVVTLDVEGRIRRWHGHAFEDNTELFRLDQRVHTLAVQFAEDVPLVAAGNRGGSVTVWNWERGSIVCNIGENGQRLIPQRFLDRGRKLILYDDDERGEKFHEWDLTASRETRSWAFPGKWATFTSGVSPDGRWLFDINRTGTDCLINLATGRATTAGLNFRESRGTTFSPDGNRIAAGSTWGLLRIWDVSSFKEVATLTGFLLSARWPVYSPDGSRLAAFGAAASEAMKLFDVESHENLLTLPGRGSNLGNSKFSPDGSLVGVKSGEHIVNIWRAPSWEEIEAVERMAPAASWQP